MHRAESAGTRDHGRPRVLLFSSYQGIGELGGKLNPAWQRLFEKYPERFLIGSGTWIDERRDGYASIINVYRQRLAQLPSAAAEMIAYRNAERLFKKNME